MQLFFDQYSHKKVNEEELEDLLFNDEEIFREYYEKYLQQFNDQTRMFFQQQLLPNLKIAQDKLDTLQKQTQILKESCEEMSESLAALALIGK